MIVKALFLFLLALPALAAERGGIIYTNGSNDPIWMRFTLFPSECSQQNPNNCPRFPDSTDFQLYHTDLNVYGDMSSIVDLGFFGKDLFAAEVKPWSGGGTITQPLRNGHLYGLYIKKGKNLIGYALVAEVASVLGKKWTTFEWRFNDSAMYFPGDPVSIDPRPGIRPEAAAVYREMDALGRTPSAEAPPRILFPVRSGSGLRKD